MKEEEGEDEEGEEEVRGICGQRKRKEMRKREGGVGRDGGQNMMGLEH
jgi:hypothetical protein